MTKKRIIAAVVALCAAIGLAGPALSVVTGYATLDGASKVPIAQLPTGSTSTTVTIGNDSRLSDSRAPTSHAATHISTGSDPIAAAVAGGASGLLTGAQATLLANTSGANTGDETGATIRTKLGITTLSGSNTGDETAATIESKLAVSAGNVTALSSLSGSNTGDETLSTIKTKLGITTLSGSNTGDQTISCTGDVTATGSTGALSTTVTKLNGVSLAGLGTGLLKNTTGTGAPSIAVSGDLPGGPYIPTSTTHLTGDVATSTTVNGHALSSNVTVTASDVSLGSVTNAAQTLASIVPNTTPAAGALLVGNAGATAYASVGMSSDASLASTGAITVKGINGTILSSLGTGLLKNTTGTGVPSLVVSGTDIKTINSTSLLGSGNIVVGGGSTPTGTGWRHVTAGVEDAACTTPTASDVGLGSVANAQQTQAAIVPNTVPAAGNLLVGNAGGTAYASVAASGDVFVSSTGAHTIQPAAVTLAKQANLAANSIQGNNTGSPAAPIALTVAQTQALLLVQPRGFTTTAMAGTTTTLTSASTRLQIFTGSGATNQTVVLPDATTLPFVDTEYEFDNTTSGTGSITLQANGGATLYIFGPGAGGRVVLMTKPVAAGTWDVDAYNPNPASGKVLNVSNSLTLAGTDGTTVTFPAVSTPVAAVKTAAALATVTTTVETIVAQLSIPASTVKVGTVFRVKVSYHPAATTIITGRLRVGSAGTIADAALVTCYATAATNAGTRYAECISGVQAIGASATHLGAGQEEVGAIGASGVQAATSGTFNSTNANFVSFTLQNTSSTTTTVYAVTLEMVAS